MRSGRRCGKFAPSRLKTVPLRIPDRQNAGLPFEPPPDLGMAAKRRFLHDDEAGAGQVTHDALCGDSRHVFVSAVNALATVELQGKGDRVGEVADRRA
jgi:hypothetical protein